MKHILSFLLIFNMVLFSVPKANAAVKSSIRPSKASDFSLLIRKVTRKLVDGLGKVEELQLKRFLVLPVKASSKQEGVKDIAQVISGQLSNYLRNDFFLNVKKKFCFFFSGDRARWEVSWFEG